jgi:hypothetical protein
MRLLFAWKPRSAFCRQGLVIGAAEYDLAHVMLCRGGIGGTP